MHQYRVSDISIFAGKKFYQLPTFTVKATSISVAFNRAARQALKFRSVKSKPVKELSMKLVKQNGTS